jgi:hypothetical protein
MDKSWQALCDSMGKPETTAELFGRLIGAATAIQTAASMLAKGKRVKIVSAYNGQDYGRSRPSLTGKIVEVESIHIDPLHGGGCLFVKGQNLGLGFDEVEWVE